MLRRTIVKVLLRFLSHLARLSPRDGDDHRNPDKQLMIKAHWI